MTHRLLGPVEKSARAWPTQRFASLGDFRLVPACPIETVTLWVGFLYVSSPSETADGVARDDVFIRTGNQTTHGLCCLCSVYFQKPYVRRDTVAYAMGELVIGRFTQDNNYYRARVVETDFDNQRVKVSTALLVLWHYYVSYI